MSIHPAAHVHPTAELHPSVEVGPGARIGPGCRIGEGTVLMDGAILGPNTIVGKGNVFHYHCVIGHDPQFLGFDPATKSGTIIGDGNHFRELCQVHRGLKDGQNTVLGNGNFLMATSHVAHDCRLGDNNVLANYSALAGHVVVGDKCFLSGHVGVHQFARIGSLAMIGGRTGISKDVPPYVTVKHYGVIVGLNVVGLRRAGVSQATRTELKRAYKELFRSGRGVTKSIAILREQWQGREMPAEVKFFIDFCAEKSKRGLCHGPRLISAGGRLAEVEEDDD